MEVFELQTVRHKRINIKTQEGELLLQLLEGSHSVELVYKRTDCRCLLHFRLEQICRLLSGFWSSLLLKGHNPRRFLCDIISSCCCRGMSAYCRMKSPIFEAGALPGCDMELQAFCCSFRFCLGNLRWESGENHRSLNSG